jgi:hypothetical protein
MAVFSVLCLDSGVLLFCVGEYLFNSCLFGWLLEVGCVKLAVVSFELVDESFVFSDGVVAEELLRWFREAVAVPWVKEVKRVVVKRF